MTEDEFTTEMFNRIKSGDLEVINLALLASALHFGLITEGEIKDCIFKTRNPRLDIAGNVHCWAELYFDILKAFWVELEITVDHWKDAN